MIRSPHLYLSDILGSIEKIERYTAGLTFEQFTNDSMLQDAIIRNLGIIERALLHMPEEMREQYPDVSWRNTIGEYYCVDLNAVWETVEKDLPTLKPQIEKILAELQV